MITSIYPPEFERLWAVYPKKQGKKAAYKAFVKKKIVAEDVDMLIPIVVSHTKLWNKEDRDMKYIPSLGPWINGDRWEDEICTVDKHLQCHHTGCLKQGTNFEGWKRYCDDHKEIKA
jgi:hypothetical protein